MFVDRLFARGLIFFSSSKTKRYSIWIFTRLSAGSLILFWLAILFWLVLVRRRWCQRDCSFRWRCGVFWSFNGAGTIGKGILNPIVKLVEQWRVFQLEGKIIWGKEFMLLVCFLEKKRKSNKNPTFWHIDMYECMVWAGGRSWYTQFAEVLAPSSNPLPFGGKNKFRGQKKNILGQKKSEMRKLLWDSCIKITTHKTCFQVPSVYVFLLWILLLDNLLLGRRRGLEKWLKN